MPLWRDRSDAARSLLLLLALAAGTWKILALRSANRELDRQNRAYVSTLTEIGRTLRQTRAGQVQQGSPAPAFTLLGLGGGTVALDPAAEGPAVHLLFLDPIGASRTVESNAGQGAPAREDFEELLENYARTLAPAHPAARAMILTSSSYEQAEDWFAAHPSPYPVGVHAFQVYRTYGFVDGPGVAVVQGGLVRRRWRLPHHGDELPLN